MWSCNMELTRLSLFKRIAALFLLSLPVWAQTSVVNDGKSTSQVTGTGGVQVCSPTGGPAPCVRSDFANEPLPATIPNMGNLTGAGTVTIDPNFGERILRLTDASTLTGHANLSFNAGLGGSGDSNMWNSNETLYLAEDSGGGYSPIQIDPTTLAVTVLYGGLRATGGGMFSHVLPNTFYSFPNTTTQLLTYDVTDRVNTPSPTTIYDFRSSSTNCLPAGFIPTYSNVGGPDFTDSNIAVVYGGGVDWQANHAYALFEHVFPQTGNAGGYQFRATNAATSGGVAVTWPQVVGNTVVDGGVTWINDGKSSSQDHAYKVVIYTPGLGCRVWDTSQGNITGDWGSTGAVSDNSTGDRFLVHNAKISPSGAYIQATAAAGSCFSGTCTTSDFRLWNIPTANILIPPAGSKLSGHFSQGFLYFLNGSGSNHVGQIQRRDYASINSGANSTVIPLTLFPAALSLNDTHYGYENDDQDDTNPLFWTNRTLDAVLSAWESEVLGTSLRSGVTYRFGHTYASINGGQGTGNSFSAAFQIGSISPRGNFYAVTSDWQGTLGSTSGSGACTLGTDCRNDIFVVELKPFLRAPPSVDFSSTSVFFDPVNGNDANAPTCSVAAPCKTISMLEQVIRLNGKRHAYLRGGDYYLTSAVNFTSSDSGTQFNPVIVEAFPGETVTISGGLELTAANGFNWSGTANSNSCGTGCSEFTLSGLTTLSNFATMFYRIKGQWEKERRYRPRTTGGGGSGTYLRNNGAVCVAVSSTNCPSTAANQQGCTGGQFACGDRYKYTGSDTLFTYHGMGISDIDVLDFEKWTMSRMKLAASGGDATNPCTSGSGTACLSQSITNNALFTGTGPNNNGFYPKHRYLLENCKPGDTGCISASDGSAAGLFYNDRCPSQVGVCVTDDKNTTGWTLHYYARANEDPTVDTLIIPQVGSAILTFNGPSWMQWKHIHFELDNYQVGPNGQGSAQGSPQVPAMISVTGTTTANLTFSDDTFAHSQGKGLQIVSGAHNITLTNVMAYDNGNFGIAIAAKGQSGQTTTSVAHDVTMTNIIAQGTGRYDPTGIGQGIWMGSTYNNTLTNFEINDTYQGGLSVGYKLGRSDGIDPLTYNNTVSFGHIWNIGQGILSDMAAVYIATSLSATGCPTWSAGFTQSQPTFTPVNTYCNHFHDLKLHDITEAWEDESLTNYYGGGQCAYDDQGTSAVEWYNILCYRSSEAGWFNNLSDKTSDDYTQWNNVRNSVFAYTGSNKTVNDNMVVKRGGNNPSSLVFSTNIGYFNTPQDPQSQPGKWWCGPRNGGAGTDTACTNWFQFDHNDWFNLAALDPLSFVNCTTSACSTMRTFGPNNGSIPTTWTAAWQVGPPYQAGEDTGSVTTDPSFTHPGCSLSTPQLCAADPTQDNYTVNAVPGTGFVPFSYSGMGRSNTQVSPPPVPSAFPVFLLNPSTDF